MPDARSGFDIGWEVLMFAGVLANPFLIAISVLVGWFHRRPWQLALAPVWSALVALVLWPVLAGGDFAMDLLSRRLALRMILPALLLAWLAGRLRKAIAR
jgi:hypothetical protein